eukprot:5115722-Amphidinium_carterae.1
MAVSKSSQSTASEQSHDATPLFNASATNKSQAQLSAVRPILLLLCHLLLCTLILDCFELALAPPSLPLLRSPGATSTVIWIGLPLM